MVDEKKVEENKEDFEKAVESKEGVVRSYDVDRALDGFKEVKGGETIEFVKDGDGVEGELVDVRTNVGKNNSMMYDLEVGGKLVSVWGSTVLDVRMRRVKKGDFVRIVFRGLVPATKEHREYKNFDVGIRDVSGDVEKK
jgi:hypothetical protein